MYLPLPRKMVTLRTPNLTFKNTTFCTPNIFMCFVYDSEQTANISLYGITEFDNRGVRLLRGTIWFIYNSGYFLCLNV